MKIQGMVRNAKTFMAMASLSLLFQNCAGQKFASAPAPSKNSSTATARHGNSGAPGGQNGSNAPALNEGSNGYAGGSGSNTQLGTIYVPVRVPSGSPALAPAPSPTTAPTLQNSQPAQTYPASPTYTTSPTYPSYQQMPAPTTGMSSCPDRISEESKPNVLYTLQARNVENPGGLNWGIYTADFEGYKAVVGCNAVPDGDVYYAGCQGDRIWIVTRDCNNRIKRMDQKPGQPSLDRSAYRSPVQGYFGDVRACRSGHTDYFGFTCL